MPKSLPLFIKPPRSACAIFPAPMKPIFVLQSTEEVRPVKKKVSNRIRNLFIDEIILKQL